MQKAFTLVEIIIVVMIMSIFFAVGFTTYTKQLQKRELDRQVDAFVTTLQLAKDKAVGRDISPNSQCQELDRYEVRVWQGNNPPQFRIRFICASGPAPLAVALDMQYFENMTMSGLPAGTYYDIQFHHPYGCTNDTCNAANINAVIRNSENSQCKGVTINGLGNISVGNAYGC